MTDLSDLDLLFAAADIADRESMATWRSDDLAVEIKADGSPVSATDQLIERLLRDLLAEHRPHDRILGEEEGDTGSGARCWVLDPIDGTSSYVAGRRAWGSLIALEIDGRPAAGMVTMPALGRRWWGTPDGGAWFIAEPGTTPARIAVNDQSDLELVSWSSLPEPEELDAAELVELAPLEGRGRYVPMAEWTTYPPIMVADGSLDAAMQFGMRWDHAALAAVVVAAGGSVVYGTPSADGRRFGATFTNGHLPGVAPG